LDIFEALLNVCLTFHTAAGDFYQMRMQKSGAENTGAGFFGSPYLGVSRNTSPFDAPNEVREMYLENKGISKKEGKM